MLTVTIEPLGDVVTLRCVAELCAVRDCRIVCSGSAACTEPRSRPGRGRCDRRRGNRRIGFSASPLVSISS